MVRNINVILLIFSAKLFSVSIAFALDASLNGQEYYLILLSVRETAQFAEPMLEKYGIRIKLFNLNF